MKRILLQKMKKNKYFCFVFFLGLKIYEDICLCHKNIYFFLDQVESFAKGTKATEITELMKVKKKHTHKKIKMGKKHQYDI